MPHWLSCIRAHCSDTKQWCLNKHMLCLTSGIVLTNDGNAILREIDVAHPAAKVMVRIRTVHRKVQQSSNHAKYCKTGPLPVLQSMIELSRTQDEEVGDGTTSVIILGKLCIAYTIPATTPVGISV